MPTNGQTARPPIRILPAPAYDPPYDDERSPDWWLPGTVQPLLELPPLPGHTGPDGWAAGGQAAGTGEGAAGQGAEAGQGAGDQGAGASQADPADRSTTAASAQTTVAATRFVNTCLEILNGYRPVSHFRGLADPLAAATVTEAMAQAAARLRLAARPDGLVKLRVMRTCEPRPGVAEIALVVATQRGATAGAGGGGGGGFRAGRQHHGQAWGLAFRLEQRHGRWLCTAARML